MARELLVANTHITAWHQQQAADRELPIVLAAAQRAQALQEVRTRLQGEAYTQLQAGARQREKKRIPVRARQQSHVYHFYPVETEMEKVLFAAFAALVGRDYNRMAAAWNAHLQLHPELSNEGVTPKNEAVLQKYDAQIGETINTGKIKHTMEKLIGKNVSLWRNVAGTPPPQQQQQQLLPVGAPVAAAAAAVSYTVPPQPAPLGQHHRASTGLNGMPGGAAGLGPGGLDTGVGGSGGQVWGRVGQSRQVGGRPSGGQGGMAGLGGLGTAVGGSGGWVGGGMGSEQHTGGAQRGVAGPGVGVLNSGAGGSSGQVWAVAEPSRQGGGGPRTMHPGLLAGEALPPRPAALGLPIAPLLDLSQPPSSQGTGSSWGTGVSGGQVWAAAGLGGQAGGGTNGGRLVVAELGPIRPSADVNSGGSVAGAGEQGRGGPNRGQRGMAALELSGLGTGVGGSGGQVGGGAGAGEQGRGGPNRGQRGMAALELSGLGTGVGGSGGQVGGGAGAGEQGRGGPNRGQRGMAALELSGLGTGVGGRSEQVGGGAGAGGGGLGGGLGGAQLDVMGLGVGGPVWPGAGAGVSSSSTPADAASDMQVQRTLQLLTSTSLSSAQPGHGAPAPDVTRKRTADAAALPEAVRQPSGGRSGGARGGAGSVPSGGAGGSAAGAEAAQPKGKPGPKPGNPREPPTCTKCKGMGFPAQHQWLQFDRCRMVCRTCSDASSKRRVWLDGGKCKACGEEPAYYWEAVAQLREGSAIPH